MACRHSTQENRSAAVLVLIKAMQDCKLRSSCQLLLLLGFRQSNLLRQKTSQETSRDSCVATVGLRLKASLRCYAPS